MSTLTASWPRVKLTDICNRTAAFPNMPVMFWGDKDGEKYFNAYFARFDGNSSSLLTEMKC